MKTILRTLVTGVFLAAAASLSAHVVVTPKQAGVAAWLTFSVSVPNEKDVPTTQVKVLVPTGIEEVTPSLKPGWAITVEKDGSGHAAAIVWKGSLPPGFRDDFTFSTQVPDKAGELDWKAYQTYTTGVVSWDVDPASADAKDSEALEKTGKGPYSITKVVDDLTPAAMVPMAPAASPSAAFPLSIVAVALAALAAVLSVVALRRRQ